MQSIPEFTYEKLGNYLVAYDECTRCVHSFEIKPGTKDGFAGRKITLPVKGECKVFSKLGESFLTFEGCLWDTITAKRAAEKHFGIKTVSIAYLPSSGRETCGISVQIDEAVFDKVMDMTGFHRNKLDKAA